jgi:hypothetical protein
VEAHTKKRVTDIRDAKMSQFEWSFEGQWVRDGLKKLNWDCFSHELRFLVRVISKYILLLSTSLAECDKHFDGKGIRLGFSLMIYFGNSFTWYMFSQRPCNESSITFQWVRPPSPGYSIWNKHTNMIHFKHYKTYMDKKIVNILYLIVLYLTLFCSSSQE